MRIFIGLSLLGLILLAVSCQRRLKTLTDTRWKVTELRLANATNTLYPTKAYVLEFRDEKSLSIKLDLNSCGGSYNTTKEGNAIKISPLACTKACCDSEFANNLAFSLSEMNQLRGSGNKLTLENSNQKSYIQLELVK
jgi:heat shock protein HslJ